MARSRLAYRPLPDATPEREIDALVAIYKFILECHESRKAADPTGDRNEVKEVEAIDPTRSLPEQRGFPTNNL
jgi:hypothetical protein